VLQLVAARPDAFHAWAAIDPQPPTSAELDAILRSPKIGDGWLRYGKYRARSPAWTSFAEALEKRIPSQNRDTTDLEHIEIALRAFLRRSPGVDLETESLRVPGTAVLNKTTMTVKRLDPSHVAEYRALMLEAFELHPDAFISSFAERAALPLSWWESRLKEESAAIRAGARQPSTMSGLRASRASPSRNARKRATRRRSSACTCLRGSGVTDSDAQIVEAVLAEASARGVKVVQLMVTHGNHAAQALYEECGFVQFGLEPFAVAVGDRIRVQGAHVVQPRRSPYQNFEQGSLAPASVSGTVVRDGGCSRCAVRLRLPGLLAAPAPCCAHRVAAAPLVLAPIFRGNLAIVIPDSRRFAEVPYLGCGPRRLLTRPRQVESPHEKLPRDHARDARDVHHRPEVAPPAALLVDGRNGYPDDARAFACGLDQYLALEDEPRRPVAARRERSQERRR
jgi:hypothetical protein